MNLQHELDRRFRSIRQRVIKTGHFGLVYKEISAWSKFLEQHEDLTKTEMYDWQSKLYHKVWHELKDYN